jgi:hypothetical protein
MRKTKKGFPNYDHPANRHLRDQPLGIGGSIATIISLLAAILIVVVSIT